MVVWRQAGRTILVASVMALNLYLMPLFFNSADAQSAFSSTLIVQPKRINNADSLSELITKASQRFDIPARWIRAVIQVESGNNPDAISPKGALGLMQLMPATYAAIRAEYHLGADPFVPHDNIIAGTAYLRAMYDRFGPDGFLAAYNCGPACYDEHLATGLPLPAETQIYVARLMPVIDGSQNAVVPVSEIEQNNIISDGIFPARNILNETHASFFVVQSQHSPSAESLQPERRVNASANADFSTANGSFSIQPKQDSTGFQHDSMNALMPSKHLLDSMFVPVSAGIPPHG